MKLENKEIGLKLIVDDLIIENILLVGRKHYPNEFGGFLVGHYTEDFQTLMISDTILPNRYKATKYLFERETVGIDKKLKKFYTEIPSKYYVGEWHTHPDNKPILSNTDKIAINSIVNHEDVKIKNPVFLVIGLSILDNELAFYIPYKNKIYRYEEII